MKKAAGIFLVILIFFLFPCLSASAFGKKEAEEKPPLNSEWILNVTEFDSSALAEDKRSVGGVFTRKLVDALQAVDYRIRVSPEYAYYEGYAWSVSRNAAAKALAAKRDERALLLYQGDEGWKYRRELKKKDAEIAELRKAYELADAEKPIVNNEPLFQLLKANSEGTFSPPPESGGEYHFCQTQKCDAFLAGAVRDFYGRYYVTLRLYAVYTDSFIYEGDIVFSAEDAERAADEIAGRLTAILAGSKPAAVAVNAQPDDTLILIDESFAGRGNVAARELPHGKKTFAFSLAGHVPETVETEIAGGELTEIDITLRPMEYGEVNITVPGAAGASVYQGAMYVGEAPLTIRLPVNQLDYINVTSQNDEGARAVYAAPVIPDEIRTLNIKTKKNYPQGEKRVNNARSWYYWAWGGTWITGIAAWISYGIYSGQNDALRQGFNTGGTVNQQFWNETQTAAYISTGTMIAVGVAAAYEIFQMARYMLTATSKATPVVKTGIER